MMNTLQRMVTFVLLVFLAGGARGAPQVVDSQQALQRQLQPVKARVAALHGLAAAGRHEALVERITTAQSDASMTPTARDYLVHEALIALSATEPDASTRAFVEGFRERPVSSFIRLEHEHAGAIVPLYDLAAAARLTRHTWDRRSAEREVAAALENVTWRPRQLDTPPPSIPADAWRAGTLDAIGKADTAALLPHRTTLLDAARRHARYSDVVYAAARRLGDAAMYRALLDSADDRVALRAVRSAGHDLPAEEAARFLAEAVSRPGIASAAILGLGELAAHDAMAGQRLFGLLGHPQHGASAALALARRSSPEDLRALYDLIIEGEDQLSSLRAALALRLSDSAAADDLRARLLQQDLAFDRVEEALR